MITSLAVLPHRSRGRCLPGVAGARAFKAAGAGKRVVAVEPAYTSRRGLGPTCGEIVWKGPSVRWRECPHCGTSLHRDHYGALNILALGKAEQAGQKDVGADTALRRARRLVGQASPE